MKNLEKKLRKFGFENADFPKMDNLLDFKINKDVRIRVNIISKSFNYFNEGSHKVFLSTWLPFSSIKDLKKQVKEKTGIVLDKPVTKKRLKKYGWVEDHILAVECEDFYLHKDFDDNGVFYDFIDSKITVDGAGFTPCPTMSQLKSYVLEHTGEKMQKVKK